MIPNTYVSIWRHYDGIKEILNDAGAKFNNGRQSLKREGQWLCKKGI